MPLIGWRKFPCLFQKFVTRRDLPPAQALPRLSVGHGTSKKRESWRQARSAITMTSTRLWRPAVLVKTRVWVGCSVSPAHKNWSRSFFIFKDFPSYSLPITPLAPAFLPLKSDPQQRHKWIQTTLITGTRCHGKPIKSVATATNPRVVTNLSAVDLNKYINGLYEKCKTAYWSWRQSNEQVI